MSGSLSFLLFTILCLIIQGIFALFEMACISFSKVRLQYYVSIGKKRAIWIQYLLQKPSRLFGTTLIGINAGLQIGSECARRFYESIHLNPDFSPISQIILVVVFAELSPMFAARRHPEAAAMALAPMMILLSYVFYPIVWAFDALSHLVFRILGRPKSTQLFLTLEEVKMAFQEKEKGGGDEFAQAASSIFQLKSRKVGEIMIPLENIPMVSTDAKKEEIRRLIENKFAFFIPVYHRVRRNVVGVINLRDLIKMEEDKRAIDYAKSPWFVGFGASVLDILDQFRRNNQSIAIILDPSGQSSGLLSLDDIVAQIFGPETEQAEVADGPYLHIERTLSGEMEVAAFNREFQANLSYQVGDTLSDLIVKELGHPPAIGETIRIGSYLFTVNEPTLRGAKTLSVSTPISG